MFWNVFVLEKYLLTMPIWGMHFAGCEIKNDTKVDMYIARKVDWALVATTVTTIGGIVAAIGTCGGSLAAIGVAAVGEVGVGYNICFNETA